MGRPAPVPERPTSPLAEDVLRSRSRQLAHRVRLLGGTGFPGYRAACAIEDPAERLLALMDVHDRAYVAMQARNPAAAEFTGSPWLVERWRREMEAEA